MPVDWGEFEVETPKKVNWDEFTPEPKAPKKIGLPSSYFDVGLGIAAPGALESKAWSEAGIPQTESIAPEVFAKIKAEVNPDDPTWKAVTKELWNVGVSLPEFASSPAGMIGLYSGMVAPTTTKAAFTYSIVKDLLKQAPELGSKWDELTPAERGAAIVDLTAGTALVAGLGKKEVGSALSRILESKKTRMAKGLAGELGKADMEVPAPSTPEAQRQLGVRIPEGPFAQPGIPELASAALNERMQLVKPAGAPEEGALMDLRRALEPPRVIPQSIARAERIQGGGQAPYGKVSFMREAEAPLPEMTQEAIAAEKAAQAAPPTTKLSPEAERAVAEAEAAPPTAPLEAIPEAKPVEPKPAQTKGKTGGKIIRDLYGTRTEAVKRIVQDIGAGFSFVEDMTPAAGLAEMAKSKKVWSSEVERLRRVAAEKENPNEKDVQDWQYREGKSGKQMPIWDWANNYGLPYAENQLQTAELTESAINRLQKINERRAKQKAAEQEPEVEPQPTPAPEAPAEAVGAKQPWEMTDVEFMEAAKRGKIHKATGKPTPGTSTSADTPISIGEREGYAPDDIARFYAQRRGAYRKGIADSQWFDAINTAREELIRDAIAEGKSVPPEVLAEYPDLAKPAATAPETPTKGIITGRAIEKWADDTLRGGATHAGPDVLAAYMVKGVALIERGVINFAEWASRMIAEHGDAVKPFLRELFTAAQETAKRAPSSQEGTLKSARDIVEQRLSHPEAEKTATTVPVQARPGETLEDVYRIFEPKPKEKIPVKTRGINLIEAIRTGFSSKFRPTNKLAEDIAKAYGLKTRKDIAGIMEQLKGSSGKGEAEIYRFDRDVSSLVKGNEKDFNVYMFLRRSLDRLQMDLRDIQEAMAGGEIKKLNPVLF